MKAEISVPASVWLGFTVLLDLRPDDPTQPIDMLEHVRKLKAQRDKLVLDTVAAQIARG